MATYIGDKMVSLGVHKATDKVVLSKAEYEALEKKDPDTLYLVYDDHTLEEVNEHIDNTDIHVTAEEKEVWNTPGVTEDRVNELIATATVGGAKIATGSYKGAGKSGSSQKNTLTFNFVPKLVIVYLDSQTRSDGIQQIFHGIFIHGLSSVITGYYGSLYFNVYTSWSGNTLSWYYDDNSASHVQLDESGKTYKWVAIG